MENVKITPLYLDKDTEERLLPENAMSEAVNVRTMSGKKGERYMLRNIRSTENMKVAPTFDMKALNKKEFDWSEHGEVVVIGHAVNIDRSELFVCYYSSEGKHTILRYSTYDDLWECVMISSLLNFQKTSFVSGDAVTLDDTTLLYLTDNTQDPIKINVELALRATNEGVFGVAQPTLFTDLNEFNHFFRVSKSPPIFKPKVELFTDRSKNFNNIINGAYQFAVNYVYRDFEESSYSPFSDLAVSSQALNQVVSNSLKPVAEENGIRVSGEYPRGDVKEINIVARDRNNGDWFLVETIDNNPNDENGWEFEFFNDGLYTLIDQSEITNPFHAVPRRARTLRINNNRLFFGNYVESFDKPNSEDLDLSININYQEREQVEDAVLEFTYPERRFSTERDAPVNERADDEILRVDCGVSLSEGDTVVISINLKNALNNGTSLLARETFRYEFPTIITQYRVDDSGAPLSTQLSQHLNTVLANTKVSAFNAGRSSSSVSRNSFRFRFLDGFEIEAAADDLIFKRRAGSISATSQGVRFSLVTLEPIQPFSSSLGERRVENSFINFILGNYVEQGNEGSSNSTEGVFITPTFQIIGQNIQGTSRSFKRGAFHEWGILYQDGSARNAGVLQDDRLRQEVKWYNEELKGAVSAEWSISGNAPSWATHYKWVYSGNQTIDSFTQFKVIDVRRARTHFGASGNIDGSSVIQSDNNIYLNLRGLKGKTDSYQEAFGALTDYTFTKGDRLRIISYISPETGERIYPDNQLDFSVLGLEFFNPVDDGSNPIYNDATDFTRYNTSGWFLVVENPSGEDGWDYQSIINNKKNLWVNKNTTPEDDAVYINDGAVIEVYTPKKQSGQVVYHEASDAFPIIDGKHGGEIRDEGEDVNAPFQVATVSTGVSTVTFRKVLLTDVSKFVVGDEILATSGTILTFATITRIGSDRIFVDVDVQTDSTLQGNISLLSKTAVGRFNSGDVWYKPRLLRRDNTKNTFDLSVDFVEDYSHSDFIENQSIYKGRQQFYIKNERERRRRSSLIHSGSFLKEDNLNGLSAFNLQNNIFFDYNIQGGSIQLIANMGDDLIVYQESKVFRLSVNKNIIESADGGQSLTLSRNILSDAQYYKGEYGIGVHPQTFQDDDGTQFFFDLKRGKVLRLGGDGLFAVSDIDNKSTFNQIANTYLNSYRTIKLIAGLDRENREYSITLPSLLFRDIEVDGEGLGVSLSVTSDSDNIFINNLQTFYTSQAPFTTIGSEERNIEDICEDWNDWGFPVEFLEYISIEGGVRLDTSLIPQASQDIFGNVVFTNTTTPITLRSGGLYIQATYDIQSGVITIPKDQDCGGFMLGVGATPTLVSDSNTITFNIDEQKWQGTPSHAPDYYATIANYMFGFEGNVIGRHNTGDGWNNFYGVQYNSRFVVSANAAPSMVKTAHAMSIEADRGLDVSITTNINGTSLPTSLFDQKEGFVYSNLPYAKTNSTDNHITVLGEVTEVTGNVAKIRGLNTSIPNITKQAEVFNQNNNPVGVIDNILSKNEIELTATPTVGDFLMIKYPLSTHGDNIRGYSFVLDCTLSENPDEEFVMHGINLKVNESRNSNA